MVLDGAEGPGAEAAVLEVTPVGRPLAVGIQVFPEVDHILAAARRGGGVGGPGDPGTQAVSRPLIPLPVVTAVTLKGPVLAVAKAHVVAERGRQRARHVAQRALIVIH